MSCFVRRDHLLNDTILVGKIQYTEFMLTHMMKSRLRSEKQNVRKHSGSSSSCSVFGGVVVSIHELYLELSFGATKMAVHANKIHVCLFVTKI